MNYKYVFVLGVDIEEDSEGHKNLANSDEGGMLLGDFRLKAAHEILKQSMSNHLVITGWHKSLLSGQVWRSDVMKNLLHYVYKDDEREIEVIHQIEDGTIGNIKAVNAYLKENSIDMRDCAILTNFYHLPRTSILMEREGLLMKLLAAESFLLEDFEEIKERYTSTEFSTRIHSELQKIKNLS